MIHRDYTEKRLDRCVQGIVLTQHLGRPARSRLSIRRDWDFFLVPAEWMSTAFGDGSRGFTYVHVYCARTWTGGVVDLRDSERNARVCTNLRASASLHVRVYATARKSIHVRIARVVYRICMYGKAGLSGGGRPRNIEALISLTM